MEKAIKRLGQNFLRDKGIVKRMVTLLSISSGVNVVEVGPGPGILTAEIVNSIDTTNNFYAIELDPRFVVLLKSKYQKMLNVHIIHDDFLNWVVTSSLLGDTVVLGSIPYFITSPINHSLIEMKNKPKNIVLTIQ